MPPQASLKYPRADRGERGRGRASRRPRSRSRRRSGTFDDERPVRLEASLGGLSARREDRARRGGRAGRGHRARARAAVAVTRPPPRPPPPAERAGARGGGDRRASPCPAPPSGATPPAAAGDREATAGSPGGRRSRAVRAITTRAPSRPRSIRCTGGSTCRPSRRRPSSRTRSARPRLGALPVRGYPVEVSAEAAAAHAAALVVDLHNDVLTKLTHSRVRLLARARAGDVLQPAAPRPRSAAHQAGRHRRARLPDVLRLPDRSGPAAVLAATRAGARAGRASTPTRWCWRAARPTSARRAPRAGWRCSWASRGATRSTTTSRRASRASPRRA